MASNRDHCSVFAPGLFAWYEDFLHNSENAAHRYECNHKLIPDPNTNGESSSSSEQRFKIEQAHTEALLATKQGDWKTAETLREEILDASTKLLSMTHPSTIRSMVYLADIHMKQSRYVEAETIQRRTVEAFEKALGSEHPYTLASINEVASTLLMQQRWNEAEIMLEDAAAAMSYLAGEGHPIRLSILENLCKVYKAQKQFSHAEKVQYKIIGISREILGPESSKTLRGMANLIKSHMYNSDWEEAEPLQIHVMEIQKQQLGVDHLTTLTSMENLAFICMKQDHLAQAEALQEVVVGGFKKRLGTCHLFTQNAMEILAEIKRGSRLQIEKTKKIQRENEMSKPRSNIRKFEPLLDDQILADCYRKRGRLSISDDQSFYASMQIKSQVNQPENPRDIFEVYSILQKCWSSQLPRHIILRIMDEAKYWLRTRVTRADSIHVTMNSCEDKTPYLISAPITNPVREIKIAVWSYEEFHWFLGNEESDDKRSTGFSLGIEKSSHPEDSAFVPLFTNTPTRKKNIQRYEKIFDFGQLSGEPTGIGKLQPLDMLSVIPMVERTGWENVVKKAFIEISTSCLVPH